MKKPYRKYLYWLLALVVLVFVIPNVFNRKERRAFSEELRLQSAKRMSATNREFVTVVPGTYYTRGNLYTYFFGEKNRRLWSRPIQARVFSYESVAGGLSPYEIGGSQQTISIKLTDSLGRSWAMRSVNKDQQNALPQLLRHSFLRSLFRDQAAALNPYAPLVVSSLAKAISLQAITPQLYWVPYDESYHQYNKRMAGRLVYVEENINSTWQGSDAFGKPSKVLDTEELWELKKKQTIIVDTGVYLKTRLFDMLISDWDRHEGQWKWLGVQEDGIQVFMPLGRDRDMSFYIFDEGVMSNLTLLFNPKFQSFRPEYTNIKGLMWQSENMDKAILKGVSLDRFTDTARSMQRQLRQDVIVRAFKNYPPEAAPEGEEHKSTLYARLSKLTSAARQFHELVNE